MTATATKPKAPRTIVRTTLTAGGTAIELSATARKQLEGTRKLCNLLANVAEYGHAALEVVQGIDKILGEAHSPPPGSVQG